jgi:hypothetical protein
MAAPPGRETIGGVRVREGGSKLLQWMPRLRLALIVLVVLGLALWFGWSNFLEW